MEYMKKVPQSNKLPQVLLLVLVSFGVKKASFKKKKKSVSVESERSELARTL